jgi:hypothetical protein
MKGIKGHIIRFKPIDRVMDFILFMGVGQDKVILQVPHKQTNKLALGISY